MNLHTESVEPSRYAKCIDASKRIRWDIDTDVIRRRGFDNRHKFLPDGLSLAPEFETLCEDERRYVSQIQGRTYANIFGLERIHRSGNRFCDKMRDNSKA